MGTRRLNLGAGKTELPGFEPWDAHDGKIAYPLPLPECSCAELYASHLLEHFSHRLTGAVLRDWYRVLEPGGRLRVAVPDAQKVAASKSPLTEAYLMGGQVDEYDFHKALFDEAKLRLELTRAGFRDIRPWQSEIQDCAALPISLNLQGVRPVDAGRTTGAPGLTVGESPAPKAVPPPAPPPAAPAVTTGTSATPAAAADARRMIPVPWQQQADIWAVWSCPRLGFMDAFTSVYLSLMPLGINLTKGTGVYWHQNLEDVMDRTIAKRAPTWLLTLDYDAVFTGEDVKALIKLARAHDEADAICGHQWNRAKDVPLWKVDGRSEAKGNPVTAEELLAAGDLFPISTGHFGLTMLRVATLQRMSRPWFLGMPNSEGKWGPGKTDPDIYFWRHLAAHGGRAYLAPRVVVGHLELDLRWPGPDLRLLHQHMYDYNDFGRPPDVFGAAQTTKEPSDVHQQPEPAFQ